MVCSNNLLRRDSLAAVFLESNVTVETIEDLEVPESLIFTVMSFLYASEKL